MENTIESPFQRLHGEPPAARAELAWVIASQKGDLLAFNRLVIKWEKKIYNLVLRMLNSPEEAADTTQDVFLSAFRSIHQFKLDARFSTWIYRIAVNKSLTRLRRRPPLFDSVDEMVSAPTRLQVQGTQEQELLQAELEKRIRRSLASLPEDQRVIIELKFFQEETFKSIAEILEVPLSTIKSRFYTALDRLRGHLGDLMERKNE